MTTTTAVAIALVAVFVTAALVVVFVRIAISHVPWQGVPGLEGTKFYSKSVPGWRMYGALDLVRQALAANTALPPAFVDRVISRLSILVLEGEEWTDSGNRIGGSSESYLLKVPKSLSSLLHEVLHVIELEMRGEAAHDHEMWLENGFWAADSAYRRALGVL